jgi:hypothetical protein
MARYAAPIEGSVGYEIYQRWVRYSTGKAVIPDPFVFWEKVLVAQDKYPVSRGGFQHWLGRLQIPPAPGENPYVWRDPVTKAWRLRDLVISEE